MRLPCEKLAVDLTGRKGGRLFLPFAAQNDLKDFQSYWSQGIRQFTLAPQRPACISGSKLSKPNAGLPESLVFPQRTSPSML